MRENLSAISDFELWKTISTTHPGHGKSSSYVIIVLLLCAKIKKVDVPSVGSFVTISLLLNCDMWLYRKLPHTFPEEELFLFPSKFKILSKIFRVRLLRQSWLPLLGPDSLLCRNTFQQRAVGWRW